MMMVYKIISVSSKLLGTSIGLESEVVQFLKFLYAINFVLFFILIFFKKIISRLTKLKLTTL